MQIFEGTFLKYGTFWKESSKIEGPVKRDLWHMLLYKDEARGLGQKLRFDFGTSRRGPEAVDSKQALSF